MKMTNDRVALAYAAQKELERILADTQLAPGDYDVSGMVLTITIPDGTVISRSPGEKGDGKVDKIASTNINGFAIIACLYSTLARILKLFRQKDKAEKQAMRLIKRIVNKAVRSSVSSENAFKKLYPNIAKEIEEVREKFRATLPTRAEDTPRRIQRENKDTLPQVTYAKPKRMAA